MSKIPVTAENYYDNALNWEYLSVSLYKALLKNPMAKLAEMRDEWHPTKQDKTPLLVGNFLHSYFESPEAHQQFIDQNPEIISQRGATKGKLKADYVVAGAMIEAIENQTVLMALLNGTEREVIVTGEIGGADWKGKIDALNVEKGYFIDFKTNADIHKKHWDVNKNQWIDFVEAYGYVTQMAVYAELLRQTYGKTFQPIIYAVTKHNPADIEAVEIYQDELQDELNTVVENTPKIWGYLTGQVKPEFVDDGSEYSITHKVITDVVHHTDLI